MIWEVTREGSKSCSWNSNVNNLSRGTYTVSRAYNVSSAQAISTFTSASYLSSKLLYILRLSIATHSNRPTWPGSHISAPSSEETLQQNSSFFSSPSYSSLRPPSHLDIPLPLPAPRSERKPKLLLYPSSPMSMMKLGWASWTPGDSTVLTLQRS